MQAIISTPGFALADKATQQEVTEIACAIERAMVDPHKELLPDDGIFENTLCIRISFEPKKKTMLCLEKYYKKILGWRCILHVKEECHKILLCT